VRKAVGNGSKEVLLTAQDTGCYGFDIGTDLPHLLDEVVKVSGDFRIRVGMMNPDSLREVLRPLIEQYHSSKVYKFLHLPVQTGSDRILESMGRGYSVKEFEEQVQLFRHEHPNLTLSSDVIIGFPGESDEDHRSTVDLIKRVRPNILNVTRFSPRPSTEAAEMKGQVVSRIAKDRSRELARLRFEIAAEIHAARKGEVVEGLVTEPGKGSTVICRDDGYVPIVLQGPRHMGERLRLIITGSTATHLLAAVEDS
jgi:threonylcarbamoyladenosine tRNA methylthiotransferase CDKAL1